MTRQLLEGKLMISFLEYTTTQLLKQLFPENRSGIELTIQIHDRKLEAVI